MSIRDAKPNDLNRLVELLASFYEESRYSNSSLRFCARTMARTVSGFLNNVPETFCQVVEREGRIVGLILADLNSVPFAAARFSRVAFLYILPKYRGGISAYKMIKAYVKWAKSKGSAEILGGTSSGVTPRRTANLYEKAGFEEAGYNMRLSDAYI